jgi:hypothetical protein
VSKSELRRLEIVAPDAIKELREQIAREIEAQFQHESGRMAISDHEVMPAREIAIWKTCIAIARHKPNQVTKNAIEEARKMK